MKKLHVGELLDEQIEYTLSELCTACNGQEDWIMKLVEEGVIEPRGKNYENWRFTGTSLRRVHSAMRLERDLGVNVAGVALALDLIDEVEKLRFLIKLYDESHDK
jgi:chaperone modulatory protein CbpM